MALSQDDRLAISKKLVSLARSTASANFIKQQLEESKAEVQKEDTANKSIMDDFTALIDGYQAELTTYDGNVRTVVTEQDVVDAANKIKQNFFFPNDLQTPTPSIPDGIWKFFVSFSRGLGVGKNYLEVFPSTTTIEQDKIDAINTVITTIETLTAGERSSGQECHIDMTGVCTGEPGGAPYSTNQADCEGAANGGPGTWTPNNGPDYYDPHPVAQQALIDIKAVIQDWEDFVTTTRTLVVTGDPNATRQAENDASIADIDNLISIIDTWQALQDFDTTTTLPSGSGGAGCAAFDAMVPGDFDPSKLRSPELQAIKDEITARQAFIATRDSQIDTNLGSINQDVSTNGHIISESGLYGIRFRAIETRLNLMGGSLNKLLGFERGQNAQDELINANDNSSILYNSLMTAVGFRAPAAGTGTIHVLDATGFSVGDTVYVAADNQAELTGTILNIDGNTIYLDFTVPKKYRQNESARMYKIL